MDIAYNQKNMFGALGAAGDTMCIVGNDIYSFGKYNSDKHQMQNKLYCYQMESGSTRKLKIKGKVPSPRLQPSIVLNSIHKSLLIYGGVAIDGSLLGDLHILNLANLTCEEVKYKEYQKSPVERCGHSSFFLYPYLFIFGGMTVQGEKNDLWAFNIQSLKWISVMPNNQNFSGRAYAATTTNNNCLFVYGGSNARISQLGSVQQIPLGQLLKLDLSDFLQLQTTNNLEWTCSDLSVNAIKRYGSICFFFRGKLFIFGGGGQGSQIDQLISIDLQIGQIGHYQDKCQGACLRRLQGGLIGNTLVGLQTSRFCHSQITMNNFFYLNMNELSSKLVKKQRIGNSSNPLQIEGEKLIENLPYKILSNNIKNKKSQGIYFSAVRIQSKDISKSLQSIQNTINSQDITFLCEGKELKTSEQLLAARSKYFRAFFTTQETNKSNSQIQLSFTFGLQHTELSIIIAYFNCGKLIIPHDVSIKSLIKIMSFCEYYLLRETFQLCEKEILKGLEARDYMDVIEQCEQRQLWCMWEMIWVRVLCEVQGYCELNGLISSYIQNPLFLELVQKNQFIILQCNRTFSQIYQSLNIQ